MEISRIIALFVQLFVFLFGWNYVYQFTVQRQTKKIFRREFPERDLARDLTKRCTSPRRNTCAGTPNIIRMGTLLEYYNSGLSKILINVSKQILYLLMFLIFFDYFLCSSVLYV